jgi:hypothetical protein
VPMSVLAKLKSTLTNLPHGTAKRGMMGVAIDKGERLGGSYALAYAKGFYGERFMWKGQGLDMWGGAASYLLSALSGVFGGASAHKLSPHFERLGDVGIQSWLTSLGASHGSRAAGRAVQVVSPGKNVRQMGPKSTMLGYIAPAMGGAALDADAIANFAARR